MTVPTYMESQNDATLVRLIKNGVILLRKASANPTAPTTGTWDADSPDWFNEAAVLGYYSEDGFTLAPQPGDTTTFTAHNGDDVLEETAPGHWTFQFSSIQDGPVAAEAYFDAPVAEDGSIEVITAAASTEWDLVIAGLDQRGRKIVAHAPITKINAREGMVFNRTTLLQAGITLRTFRGRDEGARYHFKTWGIGLAADTESSSSSSSSSS